MSDLSQFKQGFSTFIQRYVDEIYEIVTSPKQFFLNDLERHGYTEPMTFAAFNILIPHLFYALLLAPLTLGLSLLTVLPSMLYGVCSLFVAAIIIYGLLRYAESKRDFEVTFRHIAYSSVAYYTLLVPIPFVNLLLFTASFCFVLYFALREVHDLDRQKASLLLIVPAFFILMAGAILTVISLWMLVGTAFWVFNHLYV